MRTILRITMLSLLMSLSFSQLLWSQDTLFMEDFQGGALGGFLSLDLDMLPLISDFQGFNGGYQIAPVSSGTDLRAIAVSAFENGGTADNWLISPPMDITTIGTQLIWTAASLSGAPEQLESYRVMLSRESGTEIMDFTDILTVVNSESNSPTERSVDLSPYRGLTVRIAFHQNGTDNYALSLDDIMVTQPSSPIAVQITELAGDRYQFVDDAGLTLKVQNIGSEIITQMTLESSAKSPAGNFLQNFMIPDLMLRPQEILEYEIPDINDFGASRVDLEFKIIEINNEPYASEEEKITIYLYEEGTDQVWLYEELTSTTCGICPQGIVDKQELKAFLPDNLVVLSVHSEDPMVLPPYELGFKSLADNQGLPSAAFNRRVSGSTTEIVEEIERAQPSWSPVGLGSDYIYDPVSRALSYTVEVTAHTTLYPDVHSLLFLLVEDAVEGEDPGYDQANNFSFDAADIPLLGPEGRDWQGLSDPVPFADMSYDDVVREAVGGFDGEMGSVTFVSAGERFEHSYDLTIPSTFDENELRLVVLVVDTESGEVLQAFQEDLEFMSSVEEIQSAIQVFPNPGVDRVQVQLPENWEQGTLTMSDAKGRVLGIENILYDSGNQLVTIERKGLPAGMYLLTWRRGQNEYSVRFVYVD